MHEHMPDWLKEILLNRGVQLGFVVGILYELYRLDVSGKSFKWRSAGTHLTASVIMGWLSHTIGSECGLEGGALLIWVALLSLNVFVAISLLTDRDVLRFIFSRYFGPKK